MKIINGVDIELLYRQKWALNRLYDRAVVTELEEANLIEGLLNYLDGETDRLDPTDKIREAMPETIALGD